MLLRCERHTLADLNHWTVLEEADLVHGKRMISTDKQTIAVQQIHSFASLGRCYIATSWGKDSIAIAHLFVLSGVRIPLVHIVQAGPLKDPYQSVTRDAFLSKYACEYHEIIVRGDNCIPANGGRAPQLTKGIKQAAKQFGTRRYISGLRADESGVRKIRARAGIPAGSCWPICWWTTSDVFGWIAYHDLPLHPAYGMTGGGRWNREHLRVSTIGGPKGNQFGRAEWEREYYGDVLRRSEALTPERR